jgi:hypothetical protein
MRSTVTSPRRPGERVVGGLVAQPVLLLAQPVDQARVVGEGRHLAYRDECRDDDGAGDDDVPALVHLPRRGQDEQHIGGDHRGVRQEADRARPAGPVHRPLARRTLLALGGQHEQHRDEGHGQLSRHQVRLIGDEARGAGTEAADEQPDAEQPQRTLVDRGGPGQHDLGEGTDRDQAGDADGKRQPDGVRAVPGQ